MNKQELARKPTLFLIWVQGNIYLQELLDSLIVLRFVFLSGNLERQLRSLIDFVDEYSTDASRHLNYQKTLQRQQGRRNQRDSNRRNDGFDEDFDRLTKMYSQSRRSALLTASQINNQCDSMNQYAAQGLAKLFMAQAVHEKQ